MKKAISSLLAFLFLLPLCSSAFAAGDQPRYQIIRCEEEEFSTLCLPDYTWVYEEKTGITIYTETEGSIPYVIVYYGEDLLGDVEEYIHEQYTPYMQRKYGEDLVSYTELDNYKIGGRTMTAGLYTYKLQGYLVDLLRAYENVNGRTVAYTAKYIDGQGAATREALDLAVQQFRPSLKYYNSDFNSRWRYTLANMDTGEIILAVGDVIFLLPADWAGKYDIVARESGVSIYHTLSRWGWNNREGYEGGLLFSLGFSETEDFRNLPSYLEVGRTEEGWYYVIYPTDYQAYEKIPTAKAEYDVMWKEMDGIRVILNK